MPEDNSEAEDDSDLYSSSDFRYFPPCRIGNAPPLFSSPYPIPVPSQYHHLRASASPPSCTIQQPITVSSEEELPQSQHRRQQNTGLRLEKTGPSQALSRPLIKRRGSTVQDPSNERYMKRRLTTTSTLRDNHDMKWVQNEIAGIKETLDEMASEAREDRRNLSSTLEEVDFPGIKESLDEMTYGAREERDNLQYMLADILVEVQHRE